MTPRSDQATVPEAREIQDALLDPTPNIRLASSQRRCCSKACRCHTLIALAALLFGLMTGAPAATTAVLAAALTRCARTVRARLQAV